MSDVIDRKIRQMHAALGELATEDLSSVHPQLVATFDSFYTRVDFNEGSDPTALANAATLVIANIASIKDHLRVWCTRRNQPFHGDSLINSNGAVALIHDLWNVDKHAELSRPPRSGHKPRLENIRVALSISAGIAAGSVAMFTMDPRTGKMTTHTSGDGTVELALDAQIVGETGSILGDFRQTCRDAVDAWSRALSDAAVPLP
jgi:hypothetical protein